MLFVVGLCHPDEIGWKYFRMIGFLVVAITAGIATWMVKLHVPPWLPAVTAAVCLCSAGLSQWAGGTRDNLGLFRMFTIGGGVVGLAVALLWSITQELSPPANETLRFAAYVLGLLLGAWVMGTITVAWLLGHAYLTATKMTILPLQRLSRLLSAAVIARTLFLFAGLTIFWWTARSTDVGMQPLRNEILVLCLRIATGIIGLDVFTYMVRDCVRLRSTQSATGILYFASLFAYIGELSSHYLVKGLGWPV